MNFKLSSACSLCCCVSRKTGTLIVGIIDIIVGILSILATAALLVQNMEQQSPLRNLEMNEENAFNLKELIAGFVLVVFACGVPALLTLVTGIVAIYATTTENPCFSAYSATLNFLLVLGLIGTDICLLYLSHSTSLLLVYVTGTVFQIYFGLIILHFYKAQESHLARRKNGEFVLPEETRKLASQDARFQP